MTEKEVRTEIIRVRVSPSEKQAIIAMAEPVGGVSALLRDHIGRVKIRDRATERERVGMLNRINANLNMIARWCNVHRDAGEAVQVSAHLAAVERAVRALVAQQDGAQ